VQSEQRYEPNTAILETTLHGKHGSLRVTDFAPRFYARDRMFYPQILVRRLVPISGSPRVRLRVRPRFHYDASSPVLTFGSHDTRYIGTNTTLPLATNGPDDYVHEETLFSLSRTIDLILGVDETLSDGIAQTALSFEQRTRDYL